MKLTQRLFPALLLLVLLPSLAFASGGAAPAAEAGGHGGGEGAAKKPLPPPAVPAPENISTTIHLLVNNLTKAQPPKVLERKLILSWKGDGQPRYVAAAFQHEAFREKHVFWRNQNGVFFLVMDLAADTPSTLEYRLVVDGLWQSDPANPSSVRNGQGVVLSRVSLASGDLPKHHGPVQGHGGEVEFSYHGKPGLQVALVGNFNQWDPFAHFLEEESPGEYRVKLVLPPGTLLYRFVVGTRSFLDPSNPHTGNDGQGGSFSYFVNEMTSPVKILEASLPVSAGTH